MTTRPLSTRYGILSFLAIAAALGWLLTSPVHSEPPATPLDEKPASAPDAAKPDAKPSKSRPKQKPKQEKEPKDSTPIPPPLTHYMGREIATTMHFTGAEWLTREIREREEECTKMLAALNLKEGDVVCDMGCGNGFYSLKLAKLVGRRGKVLAVDVQPEMLDMLKDRARDAGIKNIKRIRGTETDPKLPKEGVDLILLVDVYHEFSNPVEMLRRMRESLKPKGRLALVEFRLEDPKVPIKLLHKMSKEQILKEIPSNGYKLSGQFDELPWQHLMFFERDDTPGEDAEKPAGE